MINWWLFSLEQKNDNSWLKTRAAGPYEPTGVVFRLKQPSVVSSCTFQIVSLLSSKEQRGKIRAEGHILLKITALSGEAATKTRLAWRGPEKSLQLRSPRGLHVLAPGFKGGRLQGSPFVRLLIINSFIVYWKHVSQGGNSWNTGYICCSNKLEQRDVSENFLLKIGRKPSAQNTPAGQAASKLFLHYFFALV